MKISKRHKFTQLLINRINYRPARFYPLYIVDAAIYCGLKFEYCCQPAVK